MVEWVSVRLYKVTCSQGSLTSFKGDCVVVVFDVNSSDRWLIGAKLTHLDCDLKNCRKRHFKIFYEVYQTIIFMIKSNSDFKCCIHFVKVLLGAEESWLYHIRLDVSWPLYFRMSHRRMRSIEFATIPQRSQKKSNPLRWCSRSFPSLGTHCCQTWWSDHLQGWNRLLQRPSRLEGVS